MKNIITLIFFCSSLVFFAQTQYLDTTFGNQGKVIENFPNLESRPEQIIPLENGNFLLLSRKYERLHGSYLNYQYYFSRYDSNGQLDTTFETNGFLTYPIVPQGMVLDMIKLNNGKILALCHHNNANTKLIRFTNTGDVDTSFGQNGEINLFLGDLFSRLVETQDNKIILIGQYFDGYNNLYQFARLSENGVLDTNFGTNGTKTVDPTTYRFDIIKSVKYTSNDKILIAGISYDEMSESKAVVARFTSSANLDTTFGTNGLTILNINTANNNGVLDDINVQSDGTIVVCGTAYFNGGAPIGLSGKPILAKLHPNGTMVQQFGTNGIKYFDVLFQGNDSFLNVCFDNQDRILISGRASHPYPYMQTYFYFRLLNNDGSDATYFGNNGILYVNLSTTSPDFTNHIVKTFILDYQIYSLGMSTHIIDLNYCTTFFKLAKGTLHLSENETETFNIYPNPANSIVNISRQKNEEIDQIRITDVSGKTIYTKSFVNQNKIQMGVSFLTSGTYILNISTAKGSTIHKLIKK